MLQALKVSLVSQKDNHNKTNKNAHKEAIAVLDPNTYAPRNKVSNGCIVRGLE